LGRVSDPDGVMQLWYRHNGSAPRLLNRGPNNSRLELAGDFVAELDRTQLTPGANNVELVAVDRFGHRTSHQVVVTNLAGPNPGLPDTVDWSTVESVNEAGQVVDGLWTIAAGTVRTVEPGYDRLIALGGYDWPDGYEVTVPVTVHSASGGAGMLIGWDGHTGTAQPRGGHPYGVLAWYRLNRLELVNTSAVMVTSVVKPLPLDVVYQYKLRAEPNGSGSSVYSFKVWQDGTPEPLTWDLTTTLPSRAGSVVLVANDVDASFGTVSTVPLGP
nr:hypothetical protein [Micromonospora sp. DSM 115978]